MPLLAAQFRSDAPAKTGGKGKPCGESHIQASKKCTIGKGAIAKNSPDKWGGESLSGAEAGFQKYIKSQGADPAKIGANSPLAKELGKQYDKKQGKPSEAENRKKSQVARQEYLSKQGKINLAVGAAYLGIGAIALKSAQNAKAAYNLKFGGAEAVTPLSTPFGNQKLKVQLGESMGDPSAFGSVMSATDDKGNALVIKRPNPLGGGAMLTGQLKAGGYDKRAIDNVRTAQNNITKQEAYAAKLAGENGFGPKVVYASKDSLVMEVAKGQALIKQTQNQSGANLTRDQKKSVIGAMAKMHASGMAHNDLHSGNIFVEKGGQASFIDFGTATKGGGAVAGEWVRMQNKPRLGLLEQGGMGFNLRSVTPAETRFTERKIKQIIGKRFGKLTEVDIQRAIKKNPTLNDQLQDAVNDYYNNVFFLDRTDAMDALTAGLFIKFDDEGEGAITGPSESFSEALLEQGITTSQFSASTQMALGLAEKHGAEQEKQSHERQKEEKAVQEETELKAKSEKQEAKLEKEEERQAKARHEYHQYKAMRAKEHREHVLTAGLLGIGKQPGNSIMAGRSKSSEDKKDSGIELTAGFMREDMCWKGYVQKGVKRKGNRTVPNCVPAGKAKKEFKRKTGHDGEDKLTKTKRKVWAEGFSAT